MTAKVKRSHPGPYNQPGDLMSEEHRRQADIQMGQLIQEVKSIGLTLNSMREDIDTLKTHMNTSKGFTTGFSRGFQFAALLGAGSLGAAIVKAFDLVVGK